MAFTKIAGPGITTTDNYRVGVLTATKFVGDGSSLTGVAGTERIITGTAATFTNIVDINGDLDVDGKTDLDDLSVAGVSTFAAAVDINNNVDVSGFIDVDGQTTLDDLNVAGVSTLGGAVDINNNVDVSGFIDVDGQTTLDDLNVAGVSTFKGDTLWDNSTNAGKDILWDESDNSLIFNENVSIKMQDSSGGQNAQLSNGGTGLSIAAFSGGTVKIAASGGTWIRNQAGEFNIKCNSNASTDLYHANDKKFETTSSGAKVTGGLEVTGVSTFGGNVTVGGALQYEDVINIDSIGVITARSGLVANAGSIVDINGDLDVDGKTNLDDLSVAGVSTFAAHVNLNDDIELRFGNDDDASINVDGSQNFMIQGDSTTNVRGSTLNLGANGGSGGFHNSVVVRKSGGRQDVQLAEEGNVKLTTVPKGISITDQLDVNNINVSAGGTFGDALSGTTATFSGDVSIADKIIHTGDTNTAIRFPTTDTVTVETVGNERIRFDASGKTFIHATGATGSNNTSTRLPNGNTLNIHGTSSNDGISIVRYSADFGAFGINIGKSNNSTFGTNTLVTNGEELGHITFYGADGTDFNHAAQITALVNGAPSDGTDMPGALSFRTSPEGSATPTERLRITSAGVVSINDSTPETFATLQVKNHTTHNACQVLLHGADQAQIILRDETGGSNTKCTTIRNDEGELIFGTHNDAYSAFSEKLRIKSDGAIRQIKTGANPNFTISRNESLTSTNTAIGVLDFASNTAHTVQARVMGKTLGTSNVGGELIFETRASGGSLDERVRITGSGDLCVGTAGPGTYDDITGGAGLVLGKSSFSNAGVMIRTSSSGTGRIYFGDNSGNDNGRKDGHITYNQTDRVMSFGTAQNERFRIDSTGNLHLRSAATCRLVLGSSGGSVGTLSNNENWIRGSNTLLQMNTAGGDYGFEVLGDEKMKLDSSGNLELRSATQCRVTFGSAGGSGNDTNWIRGDGDDLMFNCRSSGDFKWEIGGNEAVRIDSGGRLKLGPLASFDDTGVTACPVYIDMHTDLTAFNTAEGGANTGLLRIEETGSNANRFHGIELRNKQSGDIRILCKDVNVSNQADLIIAMPSTDIGAGLAQKIKIRSQHDSIQIFGKGGHALEDSVTEQTDIYINTKTDVTDVATGAGSEVAGLIRFEEKGSNNNRFHGFEIRNRNSGDIRILNKDVGTTNKADMVFAVDNGSTIVEAMRITNDNKVQSVNGVQSGGNGSGGFAFEGINGPGCVLGIQQPSSSADTNAAFQIWDGSSNNLRIDYDGKIKTATGIDFSLRASETNSGVSPSVQSSVLDDYEEGHYEPVVHPSDNSFGSINMHGDTGGYYVKIGNLVWVTGCVRWTALDKSSAADTVLIKLPFTSMARSNGDNSDPPGSVRSPVSNGSIDPNGCGVKPNNANMFLFEQDGGTANTYEVNEMGSVCMFQFSVTYRAA